MWHGAGMYGAKISIWSYIPTLAAMSSRCPCFHSSCCALFLYSLFVYSPFLYSAQVFQADETRALLLALYPECEVRWMLACARGERGSQRGREREQEGDEVVGHNIHDLVGLAVISVCSGFVRYVAYMGASNATPRW